MLCYACYAVYQLSQSERTFSEALEYCKKSEYLVPSPPASSFLTTSIYECKSYIVNSHALARQ